MYKQNKNKSSFLRRQYIKFPRKMRGSYITYKYRTSLNIKRILSSFYSPLSLQKLIFNPRRLKGASRYSLNYKNFKFISSHLNYKLKFLEHRTDVLLFRAHWVNSIRQGQYFLKQYFPDIPDRLQPGDIIKINENHPRREEILKIIFKNKIHHLKRGNVVPNYLFVKTNKIIFIPW